MSKHEIRWHVDIDGKTFGSLVTVDIPEGSDRSHPLFDKAVELVMMQIGETIDARFLDAPMDATGQFPRHCRVRTTVKSREERDEYLRLLDEALAS